MLAYLMPDLKSLVNLAKQRLNILSIFVPVINGAPWLAHSAFLIAVIVSLSCGKKCASQAAV